MSSTTHWSHRRCNSNSQAETTPFFHFNSLNDHNQPKHLPTAGGGDRISARKLAAAFWQLRSVARVYGDGGDQGEGRRCGAKDRNFRRGSSCSRTISESDVVDSKNTNFHYDQRITREHYDPEKRREDSLVLARSVRPPVNRIRPKAKHLLQTTPQCVPSFKYGVLYKNDSSFLYAKYVMEGATKWDPTGSRISSEIYYFSDQTKPFKDRLATASIVSTMQGELARAQFRIHELEAERWTTKRKVQHVLRRLEEEKYEWQRREHQKVRAVIDDLKKELHLERKNSRRMEVVNSRLVDELSGVRVSEDRLRKDYEEEKRARDVMEEVCTKLANKIAGDKEEFKALKMDSIEVHQELEEERRMLQLAEVWREERVQMKLADARLALEEKYRQVNELVTELERFLQLQSDSGLGPMVMRKAELILQEAKLVNVKDVNEFIYVPPTSGDVYSIVEEIRQLEAKRQLNVPELHDVNSPVSSVPHDYDGHSIGRSNIRAASNHQLEDMRSSESASYEPSDNSVVTPQPNRGGKAWRSNKREQKENITKDSPNMEKSEICSFLPEQFTPNAPQGISKGEWNTQDVVNTHVNQAIRGCINEPRQHRIRKSQWKPKLLEAQRTQ